MLKQMVADERFFAHLYELAAEPSTMDEFLRAFLSQLATGLAGFKLFPAASLMILEWEPSGHRFNLRAHHQLPPELVIQLEQLDGFHTLLDRVVEQKKIQLANNLGDALQAVRFNGKPLQGVYYVPVITQEELVGVMQLYRADTGKTSNREIRFYTQAGKILGLGISQRKNLNKWIRAYRDLEANHVSMMGRVEKMCRDLATPMTAISGISEQIFKKKIVLIKDQSLLLKNSAAHLKTLIKALVQHIDYGPKGLQLENQLFSFNDTFTAFLRDIRKAVSDKGLAFGFRVDEKIPGSLVGDIGKVQQVLSILIENAIKFTQNGEIDVAISIDKDTGTGLMLSFDVRDTGIGMSDRDQAQLFRDSIDADLSVSGELPGGKGGLILARKMVEIMGGRIEVSSRLQVGSHFTFSAAFSKHRGADSTNMVESTLTMEAISVLPKDMIKETERVMEEHHELLGTLLNGLYQTVCDFNMESAVEIEKLVPVLKNTVYRDDLRAIKSAIKAYDYSKAAQLIEDFSGTLKVTLQKR
jgi:nitrogen-specific signal transduction histidine kinase